MSAPVTYIEAIGQAIAEEMERDPSVLLIGEDVGHYAGAFKLSKGFLERFGPDRVIDTPIAESAIVGHAIGMAYEGLKPVVEMQFIDFIACAFNMVTNFAARSRYRQGLPCPLVIRGPSGGGVRGGPFHSQNVEALFLNTPGLKIVAPATAEDAKGLMLTAIRDPDPVLFLEHKYLYRRIKAVVPANEAVPFGQAIVRRAGTDCTVVTYGAMVFECLEAAETLAAEHGIDAEVIDLRTLAPLDMDTVFASVKKTNRVLLVHEACLTGGPSGELAARLSEELFDWLDAPILRVAALDSSVPYAPQLEDYFLPKKVDILEAAQRLLRY
jgi:pyruvate/2-oxoglutarate/acetoin dehydrogenase E1 component